MGIGTRTGQGPDSCNLASCHNCALVPEAACEEFNRSMIARARRDAPTGANRELYESWEAISWQPREVHPLGDDRYLVLVETGGRGRASGVELEGGEIGHIVILRGDRAARMDVYLALGRRAAACRARSLRIETPRPGSDQSGPEPGSG
jgi:hypothetical protein